MPHIDINFDEVSSKFLPVAPGIYTVLINSAELEDTKSGSGKKIVAEMTIMDETSPMNGRKLYAHMGLKNPIMIKQLCLSAGVAVGSQGLDTSSLVGKVARARVTEEAYRDPETGQTKTTARIAEFLFEG